MNKDEFLAVLKAVQDKAAARADLSPHETTILALAERWNPANPYCYLDRVRHVSALRAGMLQIAAYTVADPATLEHGQVQFHMTWGNTVMAMMPAESATLFARFVCQTLGLSFDFATPVSGTDAKYTGQPSPGSRITGNNSNE